MDAGVLTNAADFEFDVAISKSGPTSLGTQLDNLQLDALEDSTNIGRFTWRDELKRFQHNERTGEDPVQTQFTISSDDFDIKGKRNEKYENLFYPEDIRDTNQDRIRFSMFYQSGRSLSFDLQDGNNPFTFGERKVTTIEGSVTLPIQSGIQDTNQVDYQRGQLNPITGALASIALDPLQFGSQIVNILNMDAGRIRETLKSDASQNIINALRVYLAQTAVGTQGLIPRTTGAILNPNMELLLQAPQLRSFQFNFTMSARDSKEASQIRKIIRFFKQGMTVKRSQTSLFIVSPNMFRIQYIRDNDFHIHQLEK